MKSAILSLLFCVLLIAPLKADEVVCQDSKDTLVQTETKLSNKQKWIIGGLAAQQIASYYLEYKWWWEDNYHPFVNGNDGGFNNYSLGIDKVGHFYTSYMYSNLLYEVMTWGEFNESTKEWVSILLPLGWALSIEIGDGFSKYEFSSRDLLANSIGIGYSFAQRKIPYLQNFKFKYSYFPGSFYRQNNFQNWSLTSDYNGHIYWLSANVHEILPKSVKVFWPKFLNLSLGYGINNFAEINSPVLTGYELQREFFIGFDYNLQSIPAKTATGKALRNTLDFYHFPAPGIKKTGNGDWKLQALLLN